MKIPKAAALAAACFLCTATACTTLPQNPDAVFPPRNPTSAGIDYRTLSPELVRTDPEAKTVEDHWLLHAYSAFHADDHRNYRVMFPAEDGGETVAHLSLPAGDEPHPAVLVFPILAGSHLVSEMLSKVLVDRGYAVIRLERSELFPEDTEESRFEPIAHRLGSSIREGRRALDWVAQHPEIDGSRLAVAGVSLGGIMAATLLGADERVDAGFFIMAGGGIAEILYDSRERPVRAFRDRVMERMGIGSRAAFIEAARPYTANLDPLHYAGGVDANQVRLVSARFDEIVPPERTAALWSAFGEPTWHRVPSGHYSLVPFFWWSAHRGADHLDAFWSESEISDDGASRSVQAP